MSGWTFRNDLDFVLASTQGVWSHLDGARIFITGGTGFIGCWLLETLRHANRELGVDVHVTVLTRNVRAFAAKAAHLHEHPGFEFIEGNALDFASPPGDISHLIHAATDASAHLNEHDPRTMFTTVLEGTRRALDLAVEKGVQRVLFLSSGAVYGQQPWDMQNVSESWLGGPDCLDPRATYAEAKRAAEMLCSIYHKQFGLQIGIARIFALLGPYLSLGIHFAAGNFIRNAMAGKAVTVNGNGRPCRSYLYASDLTVWLWNLLQRAPSCRAYNVGSPVSISVAELAQTTSTLLGTGEVHILGASDAGWNLGRYVPDPTRIRDEMELQQTVSLDEAILRTALWNGWRGKK
jgi:dTDP-glucose 4,6-dehydratase